MSMNTAPIKTQANAFTQTPLQKLIQLETELNDRFLERQETIRLLLLALLTRQHALIFGKHGAAKSNLIQALGDAFGCGLFRIQLGKDTTRDHLFGPIKVSALQQDRQCYAFDNFLPGKEISFLDEIDKANTIIQNSLYTAMEERLFLDDGTMKPIPLISLFGAANRIEKLQTDDLLPLLDRFLIRIEVDWIQSDANFLEYLRRTADYNHPTTTTQISLTELQALQLEVQQVRFPKETLEALAKLKKTLQADGIVASDRRWGHLIALLKANALINGDTGLWDEHFDVLKHALWTDKKQLAAIERHLKPFEDSLSKQVKESLKTAKQKTQTILGNTDPKSLLGQAALIGNDLMQLGQELETMRTSVGGKRLAAVEKAVRELNKLNQQVTEHRQQVCKL